MRLSIINFHFFAANFCGDFINAQFSQNAAQLPFVMKNMKKKAIQRQFDFQLPKLIKKWNFIADCRLNSE